MYKNFDGLEIYVCEMGLNMQYHLITFTKGHVNFSA